MKRAFLILCAICSLAGGAYGQVSVGNQYVSALMDLGTGQFTVYNSANSNNHYLFGNGSTSHMNLKFHLGSGQDTIVTNSIYTAATNAQFSLAAGQIVADSVIHSHDTLTAYYNKFGFQVQERVHAVYGPNNVSGQIMVEFISIRTDTNTDNLLTGVLWEADVALNSQATGCNTGGDKPVILTNEHFDARPVTTSADCWIGLQDAYIRNTSNDIPDYYHAAGTFPGYNCGSCDFLFARLRGNGVTTPDEFYVGDWNDDHTSQTSQAVGLKDVSWNVDATNFQNGGDYSDAAVIYKWNVRSQAYNRIVTLYGQDDYVSDLLICPGNLFKEVHYTTRYTRDSIGKYTPPIDTVRVYVVNVEHLLSTAQNISVTLDLSKAKNLYFADGQNNKSLASGNNLGGTLGGYVDFYLAVDTTTFTKLGEVDTDQISGRVNISNIPQMGDSGFICPFDIIVPGAPKPTPDTLAPVVQYNTQSRYQTTWTARDHRPHDTGVDSIIIVSNTNYAVTINPTSFTTCDTLVAIGISAKVIDTSKNACVTFKVTDCAGNDTMFTLCYSPRVDSLPPLVTLDSAIGTFSVPCNNRCFYYTAADDRPTDYGMGSLKAINSSNFGAMVVNNGNPLNAQDPKATFRFCVLDSMFNAHAEVIATDFVGNKDTTSVDYCSIQDSTAPVITITKGAAPKTFNVTVTETNAWDRGLSSVTLDPTSVNVKTIPPAPFTLANEQSFSFVIEPIDTQNTASFTICAQDSFFTATAPNKTLYYSQDPNQHQTCKSGNFSGNDTIPPNIIVTQLTPTSARVQVNDIHFVNGNRYLLDKGVGSIVVDTSDVVIDSMNAAPNCDPALFFRIKVRDTLAFCDTLAFARIIATDCAFNADTLLWTYKIVQDTNPPLISATLTNGVENVTVTDDQPYDRGLGNVDLINPVNIVPYSSHKNDGHPSEQFTITVQNPGQPASATLTVVDRTGAYCNLPQKGNHTTTIQFQTAGTSLGFGTGTVFENEAISVPMKNTGTFAGTTITKIEFQIHFDSTSLAFLPSLSLNSAIATVNPIGTGTLDIILQKAGGITDADALPVIPFAGLYLASDSMIVPIKISDVVVNGGTAVKVFSADGKSFLLVPPPAVQIDSGSVTVQKRCERTGSSSTFALAQNYPNPFGDKTYITYSIPDDGHVKLTIYNIFGEVVAQLLDADQTQGQYTVCFASGTLHGGTYFYKLDAQCASCGHEQVEMQRMVIAR